MTEIIQCKYESATGEVFFVNMPNEITPLLFQCLCGYMQEMHGLTVKEAHAHAEAMLEAELVSASDIQKCKIRIAND